MQYGQQLSDNAVDVVFSRRFELCYAKVVDQKCLAASHSPPDRMVIVHLSVAVYSSVTKLV